MTTEQNILTAEAFTTKVKELLNTDIRWGIHYDIDHDQVKLVKTVNGEVIIFSSPVLYYMDDSEYETFKANLNQLMPEPNWRKGRWW